MNIIRTLTFFERFSKFIFKMMIPRDTPILSNLGTFILSFRIFRMTTKIKFLVEPSYIKFDHLIDQKNFHVILVIFQISNDLIIVLIGFKNDFKIQIKSLGLVSLIFFSICYYFPDSITFLIIPIKLSRKFCIFRHISKEIRLTSFH